MKRGITILLAALLCLTLCPVLADDYGKAVIKGKNGYKVHLREEPSLESESMGVYFTGTKVNCESDPHEPWVAVRIGREQGYIQSKYLKSGVEADYVTPEFWTGTVTATNYARLRAGPSTEYQMYCAVNAGEHVTIMGETEENWYYVKYKDEKGFISAKLIYTSGKSVSSGQSTSKPANTPAPTQAPMRTWRTAYREYILANYHELMSFGLIYVDHDSAPELVIDTGAEAGGCMILTYHDGLMDVLQTRRRGFTYQERGNLLCNSDGHMGYYYDDVYEIRNGRWRLKAYGEYDNPEGWDDVQQRYVCNHYVFNGQEVTEEDYLRALDGIYPRASAKQVGGFVDLPGIIRVLQE